MIPYLFVLIAAVLALYSWTLVDLSFTLISHPLWTQFRNSIIQLGYFHRTESWFLYIFFIMSLYILYWQIIKPHFVGSIKFAYIIGFICLLSYPFLSHDLFNYMFDAKILTFYHSNPYLHPALDFPQDEWLRFMHWVHRPYGYGPTFLPLTLIPSLLAMGKLILNFFFFKLMWIGLYIVTSSYLYKRSKLLGNLFMFNPYLLVEGLINVHNDMLAVCITILGLLYLEKRKNVFAGFLLLVSGLIKYFTLPYLLILALVKKYSLTTLFSVLFVGLLGMLGAIIYTGEIQQWYLLNFIPLFLLAPKLFKWTIPLQIGLLLSYYPFIALGGWDTPGRVEVKSILIILALSLNLLFLFRERGRVLKGNSLQGGISF